jgi:hypothetical protein
VDGDAGGGSRPFRYSFWSGGGVKVYIVEMGCYSDRYVEGVYATAELAMAANPIPDEIPSRYRTKSPAAWREHPDGRWTNGLDWDMAGEIWEATVVEAVESTRKEQQ